MDASADASELPAPLDERKEGKTRQVLCPRCSSWVSCGQHKSNQLYYCHYGSKSCDKVIAATEKAAATAKKAAATARKTGSQPSVANFFAKKVTAPPRASPSEAATPKVPQTPTDAASTPSSSAEVALEVPAPWNVEPSASRPPSFGGTAPSEDEELLNFDAAWAEQPEQLYEQSQQLYQEYSQPFEGALDLAFPSSRRAVPRLIDATATSLMDWESSDAIDVDAALPSLKPSRPVNKAPATALADYEACVGGQHYRSSTNQPCTNVPQHCQEDGCDAVHWRYNMGKHLRRKHNYESVGIPDYARITEKELVDAVVQPRKRKPTRADESRAQRTIAGENSKRARVVTQKQAERDTRKQAGDVSDDSD
jgi:hypothetical protein